MSVIVQQCRHFAVCGRNGATQVGNDFFCILHLPQLAKNVPAFDAALAEHLAAGRCDFRWMYFPAPPGSPRFEGREFAEVADFRECVYQNILSFAQVRFSRGLRLGGEHLGNVNLNGAVFAGPLEIRARVIDNTIDINGVIAQDVVDIRCDSDRMFHIRATRSEFRALVQIIAGTVGSLDLAFAKCLRGLTLRIRVQPAPGIRLHETELHDHLDARGCLLQAGERLFDTARFMAGCTLDVSDAVIGGNVTLEGQHIPREVRLDGCAVDTLRVAAVVGDSPPRIIAANATPRFAECDLVNVDLAECRLIGNDFRKTKFSRVIWPRLAGRPVLYDEILLRRGNPHVPLNSVMEAYQILKEHSQAAGNQALAGEFHYGELDMKRHERGNLGRFFRLEFPYWLVSGYGTRPAWALGWLCLLTVVCGLLYWCLGTERSLSDAMRLSLAVTTLQKREDVSDIGGWIKVLQTVVGAVLVALFVLAVRMRLKR
jgi:hypothetical protein